MNCIDCEYCGFVQPRRHWFMCRCYRKSARGRLLDCSSDRESKSAFEIVIKRMKDKERPKDCSLDWEPFFAWRRRKEFYDFLRSSGAWGYVAGVLNEKEKNLLYFHYSENLFGERMMNRWELEEKFGCTRERIRQVETRAFKKIAQELSEHPWYKER